MDADVILNTIASMCRSYGRCSDGCPLYGICICREQEEVNPELIVAAVEEWRNENQAKTRQSEFLKIVPNAYIDADGTVRIYLSIQHHHVNGYFLPFAGGLLIHLLI